MERKSSAVLVVLIVVLLGGQQQHHQVAAKGVFCRCYRDCYRKCRSPPDPGNKFGCGFICFTNCPLVPPGPPNHCNAVCRQLSICGLAATTDAAGVDACVADCTNNHGAKARTAAILD